MMHMRVMDVILPWLNQTAEGIIAGLVSDLAGGLAAELVDHPWRQSCNSKGMQFSVFWADDI